MQASYIIIHNTANNACAVNEACNMLKNSRKYSFHYVVDDKEIIKCLPENRCSLSVNNDTANKCGISIEICYSLSGGQRFDLAQKNAAKLTAEILARYSWGIEKIKKHQDFDRSYCPHRTLDIGWDIFVNLVNSFILENEKTQNLPLQQKCIYSGDLVSILPNAHYYKSSKPLQNFIKNDKWYVECVDGDCATINKNILGTQSIDTKLHIKYLTVIKAANTYKVFVTTNKGLNCRTGPGINYNSVISFSKDTILTITTTEGPWGKTAMGWVYLPYTRRI